MKTEMSKINLGKVLCLIVLSACMLRVDRAVAQGPPMPPPWRFLNSWTFNDTNLLSGAGFAPKSTFGLYSVASFSGSAVWLPGNSALLQYDEIETNGVTNITCDAGSLEFWFRPDWSSSDQGGSGPGVVGRLLELGAY